jgi:D-alanyl-lipoteichoic acid acyltransferase DltB (MBOAT superfamily)
MLGTWRFDFYYSLPFWLALVVVACLVRSLGGNPRTKGYILLASSSALLLAIPRFGLRDLILVWMMAALSFSVSRVLCRKEGVSSEKKRLWLAIFGVAGVLAFLAFFKYHFIQDVLVRRHDASPPKPSDYIFLLGVSYFSFKAIHVVVESYKRATPALDALTYVNYITFFPSFISGPISRYSQFAAEMSADRRGKLTYDIKLGGERIIHGLFKKFVLVQVLFPHILTSQTKPLAQLSIWDVAGGLYAYALYSYFDFSGYSDLAIGGARVIGIELPENFNRPFLQKNIREFWSNWHMSLTSWLVDYIYWPLVRKLRNLDYFRSRPVLLSIVGMNVTFIACGMWHGEAPNFILWGAYHGLGISIANVYQRQKRKIRSPFLQSYFVSKYSRAAGALLTFHFFTFGMVLFALDMGKVRTLMSTLFRWG